MLRQRLWRLIDVVFGGNVNAAAAASGLPVSTVHRIVEGKVENPRLDTVRQLAAVYGVPMGWLTGEMSTEQAQGFSPGVPEPFWLIFSYHTTRQRPIREQLAALRLQSPEAIQLRAEFIKSDLLPFSENPALPALDLLLTAINPRSDREVSFLRHWGEFSSLAVEAVFDKVRQLEARGR